MKKTGAKLMLDLLLSHEVDLVFGYPGGAILPFYDELYNSTIRHILVRHEQGAMHMAEGYAIVTRKPGVVIVTSGPGATNTITGLTDAKMDSIPVMVISGQVPTTAIGTDAFQEADIFGITIPVTKYNALIKNVHQLADIFEEAWIMLTKGRPGPVLLDFPKDVQVQETENLKGQTKLAKRFTEKIKIEGDLEKFADVLNKAEKPLLYVGGGAVISGAFNEIRTIAEKGMIPVVLTLKGLGAFPGTHYLSLGMAGMHGTAAANKAILDCDYIISLGARFDDRVAGVPTDFAPNAIKAHIDIDSSEFNKRVKVDYVLHGDLKDVLQALIPFIEKKDRSLWIQYLEEYKQKFPLEFEDSDKVIKPQRFLKRLFEITKGKAIISTDVGQHQMWTAQYYLFDEPNRWLTSGGLGTMGFGFPAGIGAAIGKPNDLVISISGDGSFQMCIQELATIRQYNIPLKIVLLNNNFLGMVRQWQELFYQERFAESEYQFNPNFVKILEGYNIPAKRITSPSEIDSGIEFLLSENGPAFLEVVIPAEEKVFPMIPAGKSQRDIITFSDVYKKELKK
ncbi:MAG: biosynthetic-type acetolactate synthase large subunit [Leptonema sp. (in: bacteria)]